MFHIIKDFSMNIAPEAYALYRSLAPIYQQLRVKKTNQFLFDLLIFFSQVYFILKHNVMKMFRNLLLILMK